MNCVPNHLRSNKDHTREKIYNNTLNTSPGQVPDKCTNCMKTRKREIRIPRFRSWARHVHTTSFHHHRRDERGMSTLSDYRLDELISLKKHENYATTMTWIRTKVPPYAILQTALVCLRNTS